MGLFLRFKMIVNTLTQAWIKHCEDLKLMPYKDSLGHLTIGWGRNLENGITPDEAEVMFQNDLKRTVDELMNYSWFTMQPSCVKNALINMNFNLGITKLLEFKDMIDALEKKDYTKAAQAALASLWAKQVKQRAQDIAVMISQGSNGRA